MIVGANGIGKSSVLEGIDLLLAAPALNVDPQQHLETLFAERFAPKELVSRPGDTTFRLEARVDTDALGFSARLRTDTPRPDFLFHLTRGGTTRELLPSENAAPAALLEFFVRSTSKSLQPAVLLALDTATLASPDHIEGDQPTIAADGNGLASTLTALIAARDPTFARIEEDLTRVIPSARRIRTQPKQIARFENIPVQVDGESTFVRSRRSVPGNRLEVEWEGVGWIPAHQLSQGTLLVLGLIAVLRTRRPRLLLLDDLDRGLHPIAQRQLVALLRHLQAENSDLQIVCTAHSPFVLDELRPEEVWIAGAAAPGATLIRRLDRHPNWQKRAGYLHPGEFWSAVGEGWVGNPGAATA
ncbi:MAG: ATP-binding protein [Planctomycetes bacterium]|nr:ATP-binding protein [Planctomycetota bacterium]